MAVAEEAVFLAPVLLATLLEKSSKSEERAAGTVEVAAGTAAAVEALVVDELSTQATVQATATPGSPLGSWGLHPVPVQAT